MLYFHLTHKCSIERKKRKRKKASTKKRICDKMAMIQNYQMPIVGHNGVSNIGHNGIAHTNNNGNNKSFNIPIVDESLGTMVTLNSGFKMPIVGLGVFRVEGKGMKDLILHAIKIGYRHFDCAAKYQNEEELGEALAEAFQQGLVKREELFITTKIWNSDHGHVFEACEDSLKKLKLDYLDLYLVHFPVPTKFTGIGKLKSVIGDDGILDIDTNISLETTWRGMENLVHKGLVRSIGISNYSVLLTRDCLAYSKIKPAVNQIETHPYFQRESLVKFCQKHGICVTAHTPLGGSVANVDMFGSVSCLDDPVLVGLADKYKKSIPQIVLRWNIQRNVTVIPKTSKIERLGQNYSVFDFELTNEDMEKIKSLDRNHRTNIPGKFWGIDIYQ